MKHQVALEIFNEIRDRPFAMATAPDTYANNCYFKGIELIQKLGVLGYTVRGRLGETFLDSIIPEEIRLLYPFDIPLVHFWAEIKIDGRWLTLDASYDKGLKKLGFPVTEFSSDRTCFDITKYYSHEEIISYYKKWSNPENTRRIFESIVPCAMAFNNWLNNARNELL